MYNNGPKGWHGSKLIPNALLNKLKNLAYQCLFTFIKVKSGPHILSLTQMDARSLKDNWMNDLH